MKYYYYVIMIGLVSYSLNANAFGLFISPEEGIVTRAQARVLLAQSSNEAYITLQQQYTGSDDQDVYWLIPVPNIDNLDTNMPQMNVVSGEVLDELSQLTTPKFEGTCGDELSGETGEGEQLGWQTGTVNLAQIPIIFNAPKLIPPANMPEMGSEFELYLSRLGIEVGDDLKEYIRWSVDQNFMFILVHLPAGSLNEVKTPSFSVTLPGVSAYRLNLRLLALGMIEQSSDLVFWILDQTRYQGNVATREVDFSEVYFFDPTVNMGSYSTNYLQIFDATTFALQSQMLIREYSAAIDTNTFMNNDLASLRARLVSTRLTRLRGRFIAAALRNTVNILSFNDEPAGGNYTRAHRVLGSNCMIEGGEMAGDMAGDMAGEMAGDMAGEMAGDMAGTSEAGTSEAGTSEAGTSEAGTSEAGTSEAGTLMINFDDEEEEESTSKPSNDEGCQQQHTATSYILMYLLMLIALYRKKYSL